MAQPGPNFGPTRLAHRARPILPPLDLRVILEEILFVLKRFQYYTSEIQISLLFRQRLKLKSGFSSHSLSLDLFLHFLTFCLISDDWNPVMEH